MILGQHATPSALTCYVTVFLGFPFVDDRGVGGSAPQVNQDRGISRTFFSPLPLYSGAKGRRGEQRAVGSGTFSQVRCLSPPLRKERSGSSGGLLYVVKGRNGVERTGKRRYLHGQTTVSVRAKHGVSPDLRHCSSVFRCGGSGGSNRPLINRASPASTNVLSTRLAS